MKKITLRCVEKAIVAICLAIAICAFCANDSLAALNRKAYWPVEVTLNFTPIYGQILGAEMEDGDSVGAFDEEGNCYGAGVYNAQRNLFYLSAYMWENADLDQPGDEVIPGFSENDKVVFKLHKKSTGEVLVLETHSGSPYFFEHQPNNYPPVRVDLYYEDPGRGGRDDPGDHSHHYGDNHRRQG